MLGWYSVTSAQTEVTDLFTREIFVGSPPSSSKRTNRFCVGFSQDLGTWYLQQYISMVRLRMYWYYIMVSSQSNERLPSLRWLATANLTLWRAESSSIAAFVTISSGVCSPVSSNALAIDPNLTFAHTAHVQGQRFISIRCIKVSLHTF